jgi:hypothetical protein
LSEDAFIFTTWTTLKVSHRWVEVRHGWHSNWLVVLNFKVETLEGIKRVQVIEAGRGISLHFFQEGCNVCLVLERQFEH